MNERREKVLAHKKEKAEEEMRVAKEKMEADERHYMEVREMRKKRADLEKLLEDKQRLMYKGMYSR